VFIGGSHTTKNTASENICKGFNTQSFDIYFYNFFCSRRERNYRLSHSGNGHSFLSEASGDRSGDSDCFCRPNSSTSYVRRRSWAPRCASAAAVVVVVVVSAVFAFGYVAFSLQGQISALTMQLEAGKIESFDSH